MVHSPHYSRNNESSRARKGPTSSHTFPSANTSRTPFSAPHLIIIIMINSTILSSFPPHHRYQHPQILPTHPHHRYHAPPILHKNLDKITNEVGALAAAKRYIAVMFGPLRLIFVSNHRLTNIPWSFAYYWQWTRLRLDIRCYIFAVGAAVCEGFLGGLRLIAIRVVGMRF